MRRNRQPLVTTDYILDELLTLLKMRENYRVAVAAGEALWQQRVARIEHVSVEDIARTWEVFRQYHDNEIGLMCCCVPHPLPVGSTNLRRCLRQTG